MENLPLASAAGLFECWLTLCMIAGGREQRDEYRDKGREQIYVSNTCKEAWILQGPWKMVVIWIGAMGQRSSCPGRFSNPHREDSPSPKNFITRNKMIVSHSGSVRRAVPTCWVLRVCRRAVCVRSWLEYRMRQRWCCPPALLVDLREWLKSHFLSISVWKECIFWGWRLTVLELWLAARGQGLPLESRKLAPGLQFVIFKSGSWWNHLLFIERAFYHMVKLFF